MKYRADAIEFMLPGMPEQVKAITGVSAVEEWGRWSDANLALAVDIDYVDPLPKTFDLVLRARAYGNNVGEPISVRVGDEERFVSLADPARTVLREDGELVAVLTDGSVVAPIRLTGRRVVVTSFDSGEYQLSEDELRSGWTQCGPTAVSPPSVNPDAIPAAGHDEWYIFDGTPPDLSSIEVFVNYVGFSVVPVEDFDARRALQRVDVADLAAHDPVGADRLGADEHREIVGARVGETGHHFDIDPDLPKQVAPLRQPRFDPHLPENGMARGIDHRCLERPDERSVGTARRVRRAVEERM